MGAVRRHRERAAADSDYRAVVLVVGAAVAALAWVALTSEEGSARVWAALVAIVALEAAFVAWAILTDRREDAA